MRLFRSLWFFRFLWFLWFLWFPLSLVSMPSGAVGQENPDSGGRRWMDAADSLLGRGELDTAADAYNALTTGHGEDFLLWTRLSYVRLQQRRVSEAMEAAVRAHQIAPQEVDVALMLAQCEAAAGDVSTALKTLEDGLKANPGDRVLMESMASVFISVERWPEATGLLRNLIQIDPEQPGYYMDLGRILLTSGEYADAVAAFGQARAVGGDEAMALAMTGKAHLAAGQWEQAETEFAQSISIRENADAYGGRGTVKYLKGDPRAALEDFRVAIRLAPRDADLYFNMANMLVQIGDPESAEDAFRRSVELDPTNAEGHLNLGILLLNRFRIAQSREHLLAATRLDDSLAAPWLHLARIASAGFRFGDARRDYERYSELVGDEAERARVVEVMARLEEQIAESEAARARGEIHLLQVRVTNRQRAEDLMRRVRGGEDFYLLARDYSELASIAGVDAGFVDASTIQEQFRGPVSALGVGEMTDPIQMPGGWFVFLRVE